MSLVKRFNRTVSEQDAVIDADAIRRGEGGGETQKGKNPMRNGTLGRSREKERRSWLRLPRSEGLVVGTPAHTIKKCLSLSKPVEKSKYKIMT